MIKTDAKNVIEYKDIIHFEERFYEVFFYVTNVKRLPSIRVFVKNLQNKDSQRHMIGEVKCGNSFYMDKVLHWDGEISFFAKTMSELMLIEYLDDIDSYLMNDV